MTPTILVAQIQIWLDAHKSLLTPYDTDVFEAAMELIENVTYHEQILDEQIIDEIIKGNWSPANEEQADSRLERK